MSPRAQRILERAEQIRVSLRGVDCCVAVRWPDGESLFSDADRQMHPASTIKVALLVSLMRAVDANRLSLRDRLPVHNDFASLVPGVRFSVDPDEDSDPEIYSLLGQSLTVWNLAFRMIRVSSNLATNLLLDHVTTAQVKKDLAELGIKGLEFKRGMDDTPAFDQAIINLGCASGLLELAAAIQENRAASRKSCFVMRQTMFLVQHPFGLAVAATDGWGTAHKPGWITRHYHDFGMLYAPNAETTLLAVMTKGLSDEEGRRAVADIAKLARDDRNLIP